MKYELALALKNAGFPPDRDGTTFDKEPTLDELIRATLPKHGTFDLFFDGSPLNKQPWECKVNIKTKIDGHTSSWDEVRECGETAEEAVALAWLVINRK